MAARRDARAYVDEAGGSLGRDGPWRRVCGLQPAGRAAWRGQGGVGELADADGAAQTGAGQHPVSRNAFCRVADCSASRVSPAFPDRRDFHGQPLVDHQHPHNVFSELALYYTQPISRKLSWEFYGAAAGEPALGPVAYLHRASALELPMAPLSTICKIPRTPASECSLRGWSWTGS